MNGPDHYRVAERLLEEAESRKEPDSRALWCLELVTVHPALAQVATTASPRSSRAYPVCDRLGSNAGSPRGAMRSTGLPVS